MEYQAAMVDLVKVIIKLLARGLPASWGCPPDVFDAAAENPSIPMRMLHYAPQPLKDERQFGGNNRFITLSLITVYLFLGFLFRHSSIPFFSLFPLLCYPLCSPDSLKLGLALASIGCVLCPSKSNRGERLYNHLPIQYETRIHH